MIGNQKTYVAAIKRIKELEKRGFYMSEDECCEFEGLIEAIEAYEVCMQLIARNTDE